jgi:hypothetical protein
MHLCPWHLSLGLVGWFGSETMMNRLWGKSLFFLCGGNSWSPWFLRLSLLLQGKHDIGAGSFSFSDYLVADFGIYILFKNIYGMRMADLCISEVLGE